VGFKNIARHDYRRRKEFEFKYEDDA